MPELLTHMLVGYCLAVLVSWRYDRITYPYVTLAMGGALLPDLNRVELVIPATTIESLLGISWSWVPLHRVVGTFLVVCLGAVVVPRAYRRAVIVMLVMGATSHYLLDSLLYNPSGLTGPFLWPLTESRLALDGYYLSSDRGPALVMMPIAAAIWYLNRQRDQKSGSSEEYH